MTSTSRPVAATSQADLERLALRLSRTAELQRARSVAREVFAAHPNAATADGAASLQDAADQHFLGAVQLATNSDPAHPELLTICLYEHEIAADEPFPSALHGGLENPDNVYRIMPVGAEWRYELRGIRRDPAPAQVTFELMDTAPGVDGIGAQLGLLSDRELVVDADGSFTITIGPEAVAGPNHLQCPPQAGALFVRDTLSDWRRERPCRLRVASVDGPARSPRTQGELARAAADLVPRYARFWNDFRDSYLPHLNLRTNAFDPPMARTGGWGYITNAAFELDGDEALVFTTAPGAAAYHAVLVGNHWWIAHDASRRSGAFNTAQATRNVDGSYTFVVASRDPGVDNWLDTAGLATGMVQLRWQGGPPVAPPEVREVHVVRVGELARELPDVSAEQRAAQLAERHASYLRRIDEQ